MYKLDERRIAQGKVRNFLCGRIKKADYMNAVGKVG